MWEEYFPKARIIGADIAPACKRFERGRITIELLDQSNIEELTRVAVAHGPFDIVIEDGSHFWEHQITTLRTLFPFVRNDGFYVVEDLQTNYGAMQASYRGVASTSCVEFLKTWLDLRVGDDQVPIAETEDAFLRTYGRAARIMAFYRRACLIQKLCPPVARGTDAGAPLVPLSDDPHGVPIRLLGHLSTVGDVFGGGGFVNLGADFPWQGMLIATDDDVLDYRVRGPDEQWSDWHACGGFAGTRGQSRLLTGLTLRLRDAARDRYVLRAFARFADSDHAVEIVDGQDTVSFASAALCGVQIEVVERTRRS
jgi:hypothetical protein